MNTMRAARLTAPGAPLEVSHVPIPEPGKGEALVRVEACGICGTDVHLAITGDLPVSRTPITLGHEAAGVVVALGPDSGAVAVGDRVALFPAAFCGQCAACEAERQSLCERTEVYGMGRDGALAEFLVAPARTLVPIPRGVPFDIAAVVTDGVSTPWHAIRERGVLLPGESVGVVGCGGLGTHAIMLARLSGAGTIVAVDPDPSARDRALARGANVALDPSSTDELKRIRSSGGLDLVLEFVGRIESVELAVRLLAIRGRAVVVGVGADRPKLPPLAAFVGREQAVLGSFGMGMGDIADLLDLVATGKLDLSESISARFGLADVNEAVEALASRARSGTARLVVEPQG